MERKCSITGRETPETEGLMWSQLRLPVQVFLKTVTEDKEWQDTDFISRNAFNDLLRAYVANVTADEVRAHQVLAKRMQEQFEQNQDLRPVRIEADKIGGDSYGEKLADKIAAFGGSWTFIIIFLSILVVWMAINAFWFHNKGFDPYPFILLNLALSCIAALQAPVIMMSQNRQEIKDRKRAEYDVKVNVKSETEIRLLHEKLDHLLLHQHQNMVELFQLQLDMMQVVQQRIETIKKE